VKYRILLAAALAGTATLGASLTFTDTFENNANVGEWVINGPGVTSFASIGGNTYLRGLPDTWGVGAYSGPGVTSPFTGNFRERMVTQLSIDVRVDYADFPNLGNRPLTLGLVWDGGTPWDWEDDIMVYFRGVNIPDVGAGWASHTFDVDFTATALPTGWLSYRFDGSGVTDPLDYNLVIQDVSRVEFMFYDPELFYIFQNWDVGVDNIAITAVPEPSTMAALAAAAAALVRRRRPRA
jgi:hypothetical protein